MAISRFGALSDAYAPTWPASSKSAAERAAEEAAAQVRRKAREEAKVWINTTLALISSEFSQLTTRHSMTPTEKLQEAISKCRWLEAEHGGSHASWQASVEHSVRTWDEAKHRTLHDYLASYAWADQVEGMPQHLREKASKMRLMSRGEKERLSQEAAEQRQLEIMREQAAEEERRAESLRRMHAEQEQREAAARLEQDILELDLLEQRDAIGGGTW